MRKYLVFAVLIAFIMISSGCPSTTTTQGSPFIGGTSGVTMKFMDNAPPAEIFDGGEMPFDITIRLTNEGEYTVLKDKVKVSILGISPEEYQQTADSLTKKPTEDISKIEIDSSNNKIPSLPVDIDFTNLNYRQAIIGNEQTVSLTAKLCYSYQTQADLKLCVKNNLRDTTTTVCTLTNEKGSVYSSSAPIQVTSFTQLPSGKDKILFEFTIEKKGTTGYLFKPDSQCNDVTPTYKNVDSVFAIIDSGMTGLSCRGLREGTATSGFISLSQSKITVSCEQTIDTTKNVAYYKDVSILLNYDYMEMISKPILIRKQI